MANNSGRKVYVVGVGMSKFIKPRGLIDYPGKKKESTFLNPVPLFMHACKYISRIWIGGSCQGLE